MPQIKKLSQLAQIQIAKALIDPQPAEPSSRLKMAAKLYSDVVNDHPSSLFSPKEIAQQTIADIK